ncbi:hypothetical protein CANARDRAFT_10497 [[Candida] arabinofermentans NRRL YB-2248]|uniref:Carbohydrate kinase PfkB domain-containing protein n=1 Tax=[Candida] arabinofermentans NRRL YB-2248 TaxID=983967 RepID=A0A1E4SSP6_9ASCO|nr:hypothetical protein CANARDRAFT_10497 [[Candida] arabinofermentans NRRL YB-2248]
MTVNHVDEFPVPVFTSMGLFIIDEIHFPDQSLYNILGGGGSFAIIGSRMILNKRNSKAAAWIVDIGNDCPDVILNELKSWDTGAIIRHDESRQCTRGWNSYGDNDFRSFKYMTPKKRIDIPDLLNYPHLLKSESYHLIYSPERCIQVLNSLAPLRNDEPVIVWEPIPDECTPDNLQSCLDILDKVDILSPNAAECASFFNESEPTTHKECERIAGNFATHMTKNDYSGVVLRCGALGCLLMTAAGSCKWFPAYHSNASNIIDPTGCGNTFVGAFLTAFMLSNRDFDTACIMATVASGVSLEQHGTPTLNFVKNGDVENELWNGISFKDRVSTYFFNNPELEIDVSSVLSNDLCLG